MWQAIGSIAGVMFIGATFVAIAGTHEGGKEGEHTTALDKIPESARKALVKLAGKAKITDVEVDEEGGVKRCQAAWQVKDVAHEAAVTAAGETIEVTETVAADAAPESVQKFATTAFPNETKVKIEKKTITVYALEGQVEGQEKEILVSPTGQKVEIEYGDEEDEGDNDDNDKDE